MPAARSAYELDMLGVDNLTSECAAAPFLSTLPFYRTASGIRGANVFELAREARVLWQWDRHAIANLALYGHTINSQTLCAGVTRQPAAFLSLKAAMPSWDQGAAFDDALAALKSAFRDCVAGARSVRLSLSAGYDSRLLLALCLSSGVRPKLSVMGTADSTDVIVAKEIGRRCGLPLEVVEIEPSDYFRYGAQIARDTSGCKVALHWHTWLYAKACEPADIHLVGSNGEFARSFYFDKARFNRPVSMMPASSLRLYWSTRLVRRSLKFSAHNPLVRAGLIRAVKDCSISPLWGASRLPAALDAFYAEQRVRHLIGAGLACYARFSAPRSPFLDERWIRAVASLPRRLKRGSSFHRRATQTLWPELDQVPYNRLPGGGQAAGYAPLERVLASDICRQIVADSAELDQFATRRDRLAILDDRNCRQDEERAFWLTLHYASRARFVA